MEFDARILALAEDPGRPLLERVKFLAIFARNLDEFFQIRVSGLEEQVEAGVSVITPDGMTPLEQLEAVRRRVVELTGPRRGPVEHGAEAGTGEATHPRGGLGSAGRGGPGAPGPPVPREHLPGADAAVGRPRAPLPLHLEPLAEPRRGGAGPADRRAALRAREGAAAAAAVHGAARRRTVRAARNRSSRRTWSSCSRGWIWSRTTCSASRATPTSRWRRTRPRTCWPPSRRSFGGASEAPPHPPGHRRHHDG